jgi:hypothetical protein
MPEPVIDPETGKPIEPEQKMVQVSEEDWQKMQQAMGKLDVFERQFNQTPQEQQSPSRQTGPSLADQLSAFDSQLDSIDDEIDAAVADGNPTKSLRRKRDAIFAQRTRLQIQQEDIAPIREIGLGTMSKLTGEISRQKMPHFEVVKDDYQKLINSLPPDQQVSPEVHKWAYDTAVGQNIDKIVTAEREKTLRESADQAALDVTNASRYTDKDGKEIPKPEDTLGAGAIAALREKGQSVDDYYRSLGYSGWSDHYEKNREYYEGGN